MRLHARETKASWSSRRRSRRRPDGVCCQSSAGRPATDRSRLPFFWRGRGSRPRTRGSSRVRRPRSAPRAGCRATCRRRLPAAGGPGAASRSAPSRTPAPGAGAAKRRPGAGHTECPADTAGPPPASAPETARAKAAATARSVPTSRRPRSTAESSHPPGRSDRHHSHARPGPFNKIVLRAPRARSQPSDHRARAPRQPLPERVNALNSESQQRCISAVDVQSALRLCGENWGSQDVRGLAVGVGYRPRDLLLPPLPHGVSDIGASASCRLPGGLS